MAKTIHNKIVDNLMMDGNTEVEDITSVGLPEIAFIADELANVSGLAGNLNVPDVTRVQAMTFTINHNNGRNCEGLNTPTWHDFEFRTAQQVMETTRADMNHRSIKYRVEAYPTKISDGTVERGNPLGATIEYSVRRVEKEVAGQVVTKVDILGGEIMINGRSYTSDVQRLLQ